jgi:acyl carrier protein
MKMERQEILSNVQDIFRDVLEDDEIVLTDDTTADDIEEWDSLAHIQLIVEIEKRFNLRFKSQEIISWKNVGQSVDSIHAKMQ